MCAGLLLEERSALFLPFPSFSCRILRQMCFTVIANFVSLPLPDDVLCSSSQSERVSVHVRIFVWERKKASERRIVRERIRMQQNAARDLS